MINKEDYIEEKQKVVKQKIMEDCLKGLFDNLNQNQGLFYSQQSLLDLMFSVLVMFNREILVHMVNATKMQNKRKDIIKDLFEHVKQEVDRKLKTQIII